MICLHHIYHYKTTTQFLASSSLHSFNIYRSCQRLVKAILCFIKFIFDIDVPVLFIFLIIKNVSVFYIYLLHLKAVVDIINNRKVFEIVILCLLCTWGPEPWISQQNIFKLKEGDQQCNTSWVKVYRKKIAFRTYK